MACDQRRSLGYCPHYQCPYKDETEHGYECVEVVDIYCECGDGCLEKCEYSFPPEKMDEVTKIFAEKY